MDTNGEEVLLQEVMQQMAMSHPTTKNESENTSDSSSDESDDCIPSDPQEMLDKAGCVTQLSNLHLNSDGTVPIEVLMECVQCLCANKLWPAMILCKAISLLQPGHELATDLLQVITVMLEQKSQESIDESESSESDSSECSSNSEGEGSSSDTESDAASDTAVDEQKKHSNHSCPACTN